MGVLLFAGFALILVGAGTLQWWLKQRRIVELKTMATQLGLRYSAVDQEGLSAWPFVLLQKGEGRGVENVMAGTWQGLEIREFDFWYYEESSNGKGGRSRTYYRFSCALAWIETACPGLSVTRENLLSRMAGAVGFEDIQLELEAFNRAFVVRSTDRRFAFDFLDARMIDWMLRTDHAFSFEALHTMLLVYCDRLRPLDLVPLIGTVKQFHDQVPRVVYELYGRGGETKPGQIV